MNLYENIKKTASRRGMSLQEVAEKAHLGTNTLYKWKTQSPKADTLSKVATVLGVSTDYLLGREDGKNNYYDLSNKEKDDIAVQAENLMLGIESGHALNFYGEPATEEQKSRLLFAVQTAMEMNKREAKKKFTPKKYRN